MNFLIESDNGYSSYVEGEYAYDAILKVSSELSNNIYVTYTDGLKDPYIKDGDDIFRKNGSFERPKPPENLIMISSIPMEQWIGKKVYHPMCQIGKVPYWREEDVPQPFNDSEDEGKGYVYDVGIVEEIIEDLYYDEMEYEYDGVKIKEIKFSTDCGGYLRSGSDNLWIER
jgi:hypothetical protein